MVVTTMYSASSQVQPSSTMYAIVPASSVIARTASGARRRQPTSSPARLTADEHSSRRAQLPILGFGAEYGPVAFRAVPTRQPASDPSSSLVQPVAGHLR